MKFSRLLNTVNSCGAISRVDAKLEFDVSEATSNSSSGIDAMCGANRSVYTNLSFGNSLFVNRILTNIAAVGRVKWSPIQCLAAFRFA
jgi:hypothetical protein